MIALLAEDEGEMLWIFGKIWIYRSEILLAVALLQKLRKTAAEMTREYVRQQIQTKLVRSLTVVGGQLIVFAVLIALQEVRPSLGIRLLSSAALWAITLYNLGELTLVTIPQLRALRRALRSARGYAVKYLLEVSLVTELLRWNVIFLAICLGLAVSSRTLVGYQFSYWKPWHQLFTGAATDRLVK